MKSQTAFLEGALGAPQKESRHSWSAFHVPEGSLTLSHNYFIALSTAWGLGFRETMDNTRPSKMRVLLTQSHGFHHIAPPRTDGWTDGQKRSVLPRDGFNSYHWRKGISQQPMTKTTLTESPRKAEEPLFELSHAAARHDCENQCQQRICIKFFLKTLPTPVMH